MDEDRKTERPISPDPAQQTESKMDDDHPAMPHYNPYLWAAMHGEGEEAEEGTQAHAGAPLEEGTPVGNEETVIEALRTVYDPEIPVNIYDLGLIYEHKIDTQGDVEILMTLTAPACPVAGTLPMMVANAVAAAEGIGQVTVTLTWEPAWNQTKMSEDAKLALGLF